MNKDHNFLIAGVGYSAGGLEALIELFSHVPPNIGIAFIVIPHLSREFKSSLNLILNNFTSMPITRIKGNEVIEPDRVYVLPENATLTINKRKLCLHERTPLLTVNKTIDEFLNSLAMDQKQESIAIILSGTGSDGAIGVNTIHKHGGIVIAQEPYTAEFMSMPKETIQKDSPDFIIAPREIGKRLASLSYEHNILSNKRHHADEQWKKKR
jgi:chemotaxis response regulator CheB